ncbi:hypothetical protein SMICM304S_05851 [Streptomyces microflavus]
MVGRGGGAEVGGVDRAVGVQNLGVAQPYGGAGAAGDAEPDGPDHVLSEVEDEDAGFGFGDRAGLELRDDAGGGVDRRDEFGGDRLRGLLGP